MASAIGVGVLAVQQISGFDNMSPRSLVQEKTSLKSHSVAVEAVRMMPLKRNTIYPGITRAVRTTHLAFRVGGSLIRVNVKPGDRVKKGQVLMQLDPQDFNDNINVLEAQLDGFIAQEKNALQDLERAKRLFKQKVVPPADFDHAVTAYAAAAASVKQIKARLETAEHQLEYTSLKAPYDGIITSQFVENHEMVESNQVALGIHDISSLEITINVPENEIIRRDLDIGEAGSVSFPGLKGRIFPGKLKEWNTQANELTRTYEITFLMDSPKDVRILPGMTAQINWEGINSVPDVITIPARAVVSDGSNGSAVWRFDSSTNTAAVHSVTLGRLNGSSRILVRAGLKPGDFIVTQGMDFITKDMILEDFAPNVRSNVGIN